MYNLEEMIWGGKYVLLLLQIVFIQKNGVSGLAREVTKYTLYH